MLIVPIYARQVAALSNQILRSTVTMNGKIESCSNNQDEQDVNQHLKDQAVPGCCRPTGGGEADLMSMRDDV
jgi:hypothetical protein